MQFYYPGGVVGLVLSLVFWGALLAATVFGVMRGVKAFRFLCLGAWYINLVTLIFAVLRLRHAMFHGLPDSFSLLFATEFIVKFAFTGIVATLVAFVIVMFSRPKENLTPANIAVGGLLALCTVLALVARITRTDWQKACQEFPRLSNHEMHRTQ